MLGVTDWRLVLEIGLFVLGFILIGIEMFLPGLEGPGIAGAVSLIIGIFITANSIKEGVLITLIVIAILIVMFLIIVRFLSRGRAKSPIVLKDELKTDSGFTSSSKYDDLIGKKGVAITDLRPSGTGRFDDVDYDIITEGKYVNKGTSIVVYKVEGNRIIVKEDL
ncbi:MAG: serine protease [Clostridiales bacterium]|nr:serine protease [Clostridiales bacterium]